MAKRQHKIKIFLSIGKIPCFCQKKIAKNPEKLIVFQGFYKGAVYIFLSDYFYPYKNVIACANVCLTTKFFRLTTSFKLFSLGQENIRI